MSASRRPDLPGGVLPWPGLWRQSLQDAAPLALGAVVVAAATFLSAVIPLSLEAVATAEVRVAVAGQEERVEVVVTVPTQPDDQLNPEVADATAYLRDRIEEGLPGELRHVLADPVTALVGPELKAGVIAGRPGRIRFIYLASDDGPALEWLEGRAPAATDDPADPLPDGEPPPVEVAVSEAGAATLGVRPGAELTVDGTEGQPLAVRVTGVYRATDPADAAWAVAPTLLKPKLVGGSAAFAAVGLLTSAQSLPFAVVAVFPTAMTRTFTYPVVPEMLDATSASQVATLARGLASGRQVFEITGSQATVTTRLDRVIDQTLARTAPAGAQASVLLIGLLATALLVELLAAGLLVARRASVLEQWRSRGATLVAIGLASAGEAAVVVGIGGLAGLTAALLVADGIPPWPWVAPPLAAAVLLGPVLAVRRAGAVGVARHRLGGRASLTPARVRRLGAEAALILVALAALATLVFRGVTAAAGSVWSDVVVLAAPVLVALAVSLVLVRVHGLVLPMVRRTAARASGAVPLLAAARARADGVTAVALVTASAIVAIAASVATTVSQGQQDAAWAAIGGDATVLTSEPTGLPPAVAALDGSGGLTVATATVIPGGQLIGPRVDETVRIVAVDAAALGRLLAATPAPDAPALAGLAGLAGTGAGAVPMLVTGGGQWQEVTLRWGDDTVAVQARGEVPALLPQLAGDGFTVVVDREVLAEAAGREIAASRAWAVGPGAARQLAEALTGTDARVATPADWLAAQAASPVIRALGWLFAGAAAVAAGFAGLAAAIAVVSGGSQRRRAVARLMVVGAGRAAAQRVEWLAATLPVVLAGVVGIITGTALAGLLAGALDLRSVTGGTGTPPLVFAWWTLAIPLALAVVARLAAQVAGRQERLGQVMRSG